jgi:hypothetical protein
MDTETINAFQEILREILAALANCATRLQRLEKIAEYYVMFITDEGQQFIMHYGRRLRAILQDRIDTYRIQFSQDYARTNAERAAEDWLLNVLTEIERGAAPTTPTRGAAPTTPTRGAAPTTPTRGAAPTTPPPNASGADTSGADTSGADTDTSGADASGITYTKNYITLPPPLTIINTQPNILIAPINQTILQL